MSGPVRTLAVIPTLVFFAAVGSATVAFGANFRASYAGAVSSTRLDISENEDETARVSQGTGHGTIIGPFVFHEIRESDDLGPGHPDNDCVDEEVERIEVHWTLILTDQQGRNQLFFRLAENQPHTICIDPNNPPMGGLARRHDFDIIGGTNRFRNASGFVTVECSGAALAPGDDAGGPAHGAVSCDMEGVLSF
jgi:hypothetical protein